MKLAFLVVYLFESRKRQLFDIHLGRIRRHTPPGFTIFAAAHKLDAEMLAYVRAQPEIEIVDCHVPPLLGARNEHAHCLDRLAAHAMAGGATHLMAVHLDSFPIRDDWLSDLADSLGNGAVLAAVVPNGYSAGLFWPRAFQQQHNPRMLVPEAERQSARFASFQRAYPLMDHIETGLGYIYRAWDLGLPWRPIRTDDARKIYDDLFFHMVGATYRTLPAAQPVRPTLRPLWRALRPIVTRLPTTWHNAIKRPLIDIARTTRDGSVQSKEAEIAALVADPEAYVDGLRQRFSSVRG